MDLVATLTLVALGYKLGVKTQFNDAGLPLPIPAFHRQVLYAVDETEMHILQPTYSSYHIKESPHLRFGAEEMSKF